MSIFLLLFQCSSQDDSDQRLRDIISSKSLTADPTTGRILPSPTDPVAYLGKLLFFSKALSGDKDTACVSCHHPMLGGGDALPLPIGVGALQPDLLGPGRQHGDGKFTVPRNAPTTFNIAFYDKFLFDDGRIESLGKTATKNGDDGLGIRTPESFTNIADPNAGSNLVQAQSRFPVTSREEMKGYNFEAIITNPIVNNPIVRNHLAARLGNYGVGAGELTTNNWLVEFQKAFPTVSPQDAPTLITATNIALALGEYERSQVFINNPWKSYVDGDNNALSLSAKEGAILFFTDIKDNGGGCHNCHQGSFFTDEKFHVIAVPQVGKGKADGSDGTDDFGRKKVTFSQDDIYAFRTPTLLNIEMTMPYSHAGAYNDLSAIVSHHVNVKKALETFNYDTLNSGLDTSKAQVNTAKALAQLEKNRATKQDSLQDASISSEQVAQIVEFLKSLTDPCVKDRNCMAPWLPSESDPNPDLLRLVAVDRNGKAL